MARLVLNSAERPQPAATITVQRCNGVHLSHLLAPGLENVSQPADKQLRCSKGAARAKSPQSLSVGQLPG